MNLQSKQVVTPMSIQELVNNALGQETPINNMQEAALALQTNALHTNATLRHEEWREFDQQLLDVARERLVIVNRLRARGLVKSLGSIGTTISSYERVGELTAAQVDMDPATEPEKDRLTFDAVNVPVPVFHKAWQIGMRQLAASRNLGESLDTTTARAAARVVVDAMEDSVTNGLPNLNYGSGNVYGLTTHPNRQTHSVTNWTSDSGATILADVRAMIDKLFAVNKYGPYELYVAKDIWPHLDEDYSASKGSNTIRERILANPDISAVVMVPTLAAGNATLVQLEPDTIDLAVAQDLRNVQWNSQPFITQYQALSIMVPRVKADKNNQCGICHAS